MRASARFCTIHAAFAAVGYIGLRCICRTAFMMRDRATGVHVMLVKLIREAGCWIEVSVGVTD